MAQNATNKRMQSFSPSGLSDAQDAANVFQGACAQLIDLIPDPTTKNLWVCRPARTPLTLFPGFTTPGFISVMRVIGNRVYGMIATGLNPGKDQPFCYEIDSGSFIAITGVTNPNTPASPATSGAWTPPTMELVGTRLIVTHPGFTGAAGIFFGWIDLTNPAVPTWNAGNTSVTALPFVPVAVANYQGSAAFAVGEAMYMTDPLSLDVDPDNVFTFGDNTDIVGFKGLGLSTEQGGIVQSLIVFKETLAAFQFKGSPFSTPSTASIDGMPNAVGTESPMSLVDSPIGLGLIAPDGLRFVGMDAAWSDPIGTEGSGVNVPFLKSLVPSRVNAACNGSVLIVSVQNGGVAGTPVQEYWLHLNRASKVWSGPHTFPSSMVEPYKNKFVAAPVDHEGALYLVETFPTTVSVYEEMGERLQWTMATVMFANYTAQAVYNFNNMTVNIALDPGMVSWNVRIVNPQSVEYDDVVNLVPNTTPIWDTAIWDQDVWDGIAQGLTPRRIDFDKDISTTRAQIIISGGSAAGVIIGETKYNQGEYSYVPQVGV